MAEDPTTGLDPDEDPGDPKDPSQEDPGTGDPGQEDPEKKPADQDPELAKAIRTRDQAKAKARELQDRVKELEEKLNPGKADPVAQANRRLVAAETRTVLTAAGVKDPADQKALLGFLDLASITVGNDGEVDTDAIQDQVDTLISVAKKLAGTGGGGKRTPRLDTRDLGGEKGKPADPAKARRMAMLQG